MNLVTLYFYRTISFSFSFFFSFYSFFYHSFVAATTVCVYIRGTFGSSPLLGQRIIMYRVTRVNRVTRHSALGTFR